MQTKNLALVAMATGAMILSVRHAGADANALLGGDLAGTFQDAAVTQLSGQDGVVAQPSQTTIMMTQGGTLARPLVERPLTWQPIDPTKAPFGAWLSWSPFISTVDSVLGLGYNYDRAIHGEPAAAWVIEQDYEQSPGVHALEQYMQIVDETGSVDRPIFAHHIRGSSQTDVVIQYSAPGTFNIEQATTGEQVYSANAAVHYWMLQGAVAMELDQVGGLTLDNSRVQFTSFDHPIVTQIENTADGATGNAMTVEAQNTPGATTQGGALDLHAGTGTAAYGAINLRGALNVGRASLSSMTDGDYTLTPDEAAHGILEVPRTVRLTGKHDVIVPAVDGWQFTVANLTDRHKIKFKTATGKGVTIESRKRAIVYCDGVDIVRVTPDADADSDCDSD